MLSSTSRTTPGSPDSSSILSLKCGAVHCQTAFDLLRPVYVPCNWAAKRPLSVGLLKEVAREKICLDEDINSGGAAVPCSGNGKSGGAASSSGSSPKNDPQRPDEEDSSSPCSFTKTVQLRDPSGLVVHELTLKIAEKRETSSAAKEIATITDGQSGVAQKHLKALQACRYLEDHDVAGLIRQLISALLVEKPEHPADWIVGNLHRVAAGCGAALSACSVTEGKNAPTLLEHRAAGEQAGNHDSPGTATPKKKLPPRAAANAVQVLTELRLKAAMNSSNPTADQFPWDRLDSDEIARRGEKKLLTPETWAGMCLMQAGDHFEKDPAMYIVLAGRLHVKCPDTGVLINVLQKGAFVGERAMVAKMVARERQKLKALKKIRSESKEGPIVRTGTVVLAPAYGYFSESGEQEVDTAEVLRIELEEFEELIWGPLVEHAANAPEEKLLKTAPGRHTQVPYRQVLVPAVSSGGGVVYQL